MSDAVVMMYLPRLGEPKELGDGASVRIGEGVTPFTVPGCGKQEYATVRVEGESLVVSCHARSDGLWLLVREGPVSAMDDYVLETLDEAALWKSVLAPGAAGTWTRRVRTERGVHTLDANGWRILWLSSHARGVERVRKVAWMILPGAKLWLAPATKEAATVRRLPGEVIRQSERLPPLERATTLKALCVSLGAACLERDASGAVSLRHGAVDIEERWCFPVERGEDPVTPRARTLREWITDSAGEATVRLVVSAKGGSYMLASVEAPGRRCGLVVPVDETRPLGALDHEITNHLRRVVSEAINPWNEWTPTNLTQPSPGRAELTGDVAERYQALVDASRTGLNALTGDAWLEWLLGAASARGDRALAGEVARAGLFCAFKFERKFKDAATALHLTVLACHEDDMPTQDDRDDYVEQCVWERLGGERATAARGAIDKKRLGAVLAHAHLAQAVAPSWVEGGERRVCLRPGSVMSAGGGRSHAAWFSGAKPFSEDDAVARYLAQLLESGALRAVVAHARANQDEAACEARLRALRAWVETCAPDDPKREIRKRTLEALG